MNVIARLDFELAYYDVAVKHISLDVMGIPLINNLVLLSLF